MKEANEKFRQLSCQQEIQGKISTIDHYEYSSFMNENFFGLDIETNDSLKNNISYQFEIDDNKNLLGFVKIGQEIRKEKGNDMFSLKTSDGITKEFQLPACDKK